MQIINNKLSLNKFIPTTKNYLSQLVCIAMVATLSACGGQSSQDGSSASAAGATLQSSSQSAQANTSLLDSLAVLYPNGKMSAQQKVLAAKELSQNPAALRLSAPTPMLSGSQNESISFQSVAATGNFGPVFRIQNTTLSGSYFFTIYDFERDSALSLHPEWNLEGTAFYTSRVADTGLNPVHRFQNKINGSYLYTIYEAERADIVANFSDFYAYEGVSWHARQTTDAGYTPLYRFRNTANGTYLFSAYESEKDAIIANYSNIFVLEGIAYYVRQSLPSPLLTLSLVAGGLGGAGNADGVGAAARFNRPIGVAVDSMGNLFLADNSSHTIRKITPLGVISTFAGIGFPGYLNGTGTAAVLFNPTGIAIDGMDNLYVTENFTRIVRKITPAGVVTTFAGVPNGPLASTDGAAAVATFISPRGITIDSAGNLYVIDGNAIRKITLAGAVTTLAGSALVSGYLDAAGAVARFSSPQGITIDDAGNLYVADSSNSVIRKITTLGMVSTFAGTAGSRGITEGLGATARFNFPNDVAIDDAGILYVSDAGNKSIRKILSTGLVSTFAGISNGSGNNAGDSDGAGMAASFRFPTGLAVDGSGNLYMTDSAAMVVRKISPAAAVTTLAGLPNASGSADGIGASARFYNPAGMVSDGAGNMYVVDSFNHTIRKITPAGVVSTFAGGAPFDPTIPCTSSIDGTGATVRFNDIRSITIDPAGNLYVTDTITIRKITPSAVVTTFAGNRCTVGSADGQGVAALFGNYLNITSDSVGNLFVTDQNYHTIRKITPAGTVITFAGAAGSIGTIDSAGAEARFNYPSGIASDAAGNLFVTDSRSHTVRKITSVGQVSTLAGVAGLTGYQDGVGTAVRLNSPYAIATDGVGNVYIPDVTNSTIRKITAAGVVSTVIGDRAARNRKKVIEGVLPAGLNTPLGVYINADKLYITDENAVLKINGLP